MLNQVVFSAEYMRLAARMACTVIVRFEVLMRWIEDVAVGAVIPPRRW